MAGCLIGTTAPTPGFVRGLFLTHVDEPGTAREAYFTLVSRLRTVRRKVRDHVFHRLIQAPTSATA